MSVDVPSMIAERTRDVDTLLEAFLRDQRGSPPRLIEAIRYSVFAGGKRLRPALVLEWASAVRAGRDPNDPKLFPGTYASAGAIELIHAFSLVHDDLPSMDNDDLRRGKPTNHKVFGEAMAILAGDAMTTMAFELITMLADPSVSPMLVLELAKASGPRGMIGGQSIDIENESRSISLDQLEQLHKMKTGALLRCACRLGVIAEGGDEAMLDRATAYGENLGLAFQIADDLLDVTSNEKQLGKSAHKDDSAGKNTYPKLVGIEESRKIAKSGLEKAVASLDPSNPGTERLTAIAMFVVERDR